jgi:hypothetical protein
MCLLYKVFLDKPQYLHGVTKRSKYSSAPTGALLHLQVVWCPQLNVIHRQCFANLQRVCEFVKENMHVRVQEKNVKRLCISIIFAQDYPIMSMHRILATSL